LDEVDIREYSNNYCKESLGSTDEVDKSFCNKIAKNLSALKNENDMKKRTYDCYYFNHWLYDNIGKKYYKGNAKGEKDKVSENLFNFVTLAISQHGQEKTKPEIAVAGDSTPKGEDGASAKASEKESGAAKHGETTPAPAETVEAKSATTILAKPEPALVKPAPAKPVGVCEHYFKCENRYSPENLLTKLQKELQLLEKKLKAGGAEETLQAKKSEKTGPEESGQEEKKPERAGQEKTKPENGGFCEPYFKCKSKYSPQNLLTKLQKELQALEKKLEAGGAEETLQPKKSEQTGPEKSGQEKTKPEIAVAGDSTPKGEDGASAKASEKESGAAKHGETTPAPAETVEAKSATTILAKPEPALVKPAPAKPVAAKAPVEKSIAPELGGAKPAAAKPETEKVAEANLATAESQVAKPVAAKSVASKPEKENLEAAESEKAKPAAAEPIAVKPKETVSAEESAETKEAEEEENEEETTEGLTDEEVTAEDVVTETTSTVQHEAALVPPPIESFEQGSEEEATKVTVALEEAPEEVVNETTNTLQPEEPFGTPPIESAEQGVHVISSHNTEPASNALPLTIADTPNILGTTHEESSDNCGFL
ncbi:Plasmodium vivax Vir protein, putative, partial [Plasmodium vivax]